MSADNWTTCPGCLKRAEARYEAGPPEPLSEEFVERVTAAVLARIRKSERRGGDTRTEAQRAQAEADDAAALAAVQQHWPIGPGSLGELLDWSDEHAGKVLRRLFGAGRLKRKRRRSSFVYLPVKP